MDFKNQALEFLGIGSVTHSGNEAVVDYLVSFFEALRAKIIIQKVGHSKKQFNIIGIIGDDLVDATHPKGLLLLSHVDTPSPGNAADWKHLNSEPWKPQVDGDKIIGLGSASAKLDFLCKLEACKQFVGKNLIQPIYLAATCGGESLLLGGKYLVESGVICPKYALVGHPTSLQIINRHKSRLNISLQLSFVAIVKDVMDFDVGIEIKSKSESAHVASSLMMDSAIEKLLRLLRKLKEKGISIRLRSIEGGGEINKVADSAFVSFMFQSVHLDKFRREFKKYLQDNPNDFFELKFVSVEERGVCLFPPDFLDAIFELKDEMESIDGKIKKQNNEEFSPPYSQIVLNSLFQDKGTVSMDLNISLLPEFATVEEKQKLEREIKQAMGRVGRKHSKISFRFQRKASLPPMHTDREDIFVKSLVFAIRRIGVESKVVSGSAFTEGAFFSHQGIPTVAFGPGKEEGNSHGADEYNEFSQLDIATRFYIQVLDSFCVRGI